MSPDDQITIADIYSRLHDYPASELALQRAKTDESDPRIAAYIHFVRGELAEAAGDKVRAVLEMNEFGAACAKLPFGNHCGGNICRIELVEEAIAHPETADAAFASGGHFVDCYRFRADIPRWSGRLAWRPKNVCGCSRARTGSSVRLLKSRERLPDHILGMNGAELLLARLMFPGLRSERISLWRVHHGILPCVRNEATGRIPVEIARCLWP
jgi:hypothetical protein